MTDDDDDDDDDDDNDDDDDTLLWYIFNWSTKSRVLLFPPVPVC